MIGTSIFPVIGTAIGSFIGDIVGTFLGDLFGGQPSAEITVGAADGVLKGVFAEAHNGADAAIFRPIGDAVEGAVNAVIGATGASLDSLLFGNLVYSSRATRLERTFLASATKPSRPIPTPVRPGPRSRSTASWRCCTRPI